MSLTSMKALAGRVAGRVPGAEVVQGDYGKAVGVRVGRRGVWLRRPEPWIPNLDDGFYLEADEADEDAIVRVLTAAPRGEDA